MVRGSGLLPNSQDAAANSIVRNVHNKNNPFNSSQFNLLTMMDASYPTSTAKHSVEDGLWSDEVPSVQETTAFERRKKHVLVGFAILALLVISLAVGLGVRLGGPEDNQEQGAPLSDMLPPVSQETDSTGATEASVSTTFPSAAPQGNYLDQMMLDLSSNTLESLEIATSPQRKAIDWLELHPNLPVMEEERKLQLFALVTFFHAMDGPNWRSMGDSWLNHSLHECNWYHVPDECVGEKCHNITQCNSDEEVTAISLGLTISSSIDVYIPPEITLLSSLAILSLPNNGIQTPLATFLPTEIYEMSTLREIIVHNNQMKGTIPTEFGRMDKLKAMSMASNSFTGTIPTELGLMTSVRDMYVWNCQLTGTVPTELGLLRQMEDMELLGNQLEGPIPTELGLMTNAETIHIQSNRFTGSIPSEFGAMPKLRSLSLRENELTGRIPSHLGYSSTLEVLRLNDNALIGAIPEDIGNLAEKLVRITMHGNALLGTVLPKLCSLGEYSDTTKIGLSFDCDSRLCGCDWCNCQGIANGTDTSDGPGE